MGTSVLVLRACGDLQLLSTDISLGPYMFSVMNTVFLKTDGAGVAATISVNCLQPLSIVEDISCAFEWPARPCVRVAVDNCLKKESGGHSSILFCN